MLKKLENVSNKFSKRFGECTVYQNFVATDRNILDIKKKLPTYFKENMKNIFKNCPLFALILKSKLQVIRRS